MKNKKKGMSITGKQRAAGWIYLAPATILIFIMSFWPIIQAVITSFKTGSSANMQWANPFAYNYTRMFQDAVFKRSIGNTFLYLIIEVPIMLVLAILLAQLLNNKHLKFKGLFRTCVFLPCATSLVSYALIFKSLFATQGLINTILVKLGILESNFNFLGTGWSAKIIIIVALIWRWTGYNMVFFLAGLQNIEYSVYEAAKIDGATAMCWISSNFTRRSPSSCPTPPRKRANHHPFTGESSPPAMTCIRRPSPWSCGRTCAMSMAHFLPGPPIPSCLMSAAA